MSAEYHKIQTLWLRDPETKFQSLLRGQWAKPEFNYLNALDWTWTEKVDGTNVRIELHTPEGSIFRNRVKGKTDAATLHPDLLEQCYEIAARVPEDLGGLTLYGEGYGPGIQKGGGNYGPEKDFVLFDVVTADGLWLERANVEDIAAKLGIRVAPVVGVGPLAGAIDLTEAGFSSSWGSFLAEGLVMRPTTELRNRRGERIITKLKHKDFSGLEGGT